MRFHVPLKVMIAPRGLPDKKGFVYFIGLSIFAGGTILLSQMRIALGYSPKILKKRFIETMGFALMK